MFCFQGDGWAFLEPSKVADLAEATSKFQLLKAKSGGKTWMAIANQWFPRTQLS